MVRGETRTTSKTFYTEEMHRSMYLLSCVQSVWGFVRILLILDLGRGLEAGRSSTDKTQSVYGGVIKTTLLLLTCSITSRHSESDSAQMETTMSQSCYCL